jgi:hypothetical protein
MKIGLDLHGILDVSPELWKEITDGLILLGHEVHIITGAKRIEALDFLDKNEIKYTYIYSITDDLLDRKIPNVIYKGKTSFDNSTWNQAKANYCKKNKIDYHLDDTENYGKHFKTPFIYYKKIK